MIIKMISCLLLCSMPVMASWPNFQGPNLNGISDEKGLIRSFPEEGPNILWRLEVGSGFGGASIDGDEIFIMDREVGEQDILRCIDFKTGKEKWRCVNDVPGRIEFHGSRCVPTITEDYVYSAGPFGHVYICDRKEKAFVKIVDLGDVFDVETKPRFGYSHAPFVYKDTLIVTPMGKKAGLAAIDRITGKTVWTTSSFGELTYGSYMPATLQTIAGEQGLLYVVEGHVLFLDPETGKTIWDYTGFNCVLPIPYPTVINGDHLFITGGYESGSVMIQVLKEKDKYQFKELFRLDKRGSQVQQAIYYNDLIFANFNTNENLDDKNDEGFVCLDMNGKTLWQTKLNPRVDRGNFIIADDMIIALGGRRGELILAKATGESYQELVREKVFKKRGKNIWAPIALSQGKLVVRDQREMICIDIKVKGI